MNELICYCFNYSEEDIEQDVRKNNGHSAILEKVRAAKEAGACRCFETNPKGK